MVWNTHLFIQLCHSLTVMVILLWVAHLLSVKHSDAWLSGDCCSCLVFSWSLQPSDQAVCLSLNTRLNMVQLKPVRFPTGKFHYISLKTVFNQNAYVLSQYMCHRQLHSRIKTHTTFKFCSTAVRFCMFFSRCVLAWFCK